MKDDVPFTDGTIKVADLWKQINTEMEDATLLRARLFECWINEDESAAAGSEASWERCPEALRAAAVPALYNNRAGWVKLDGAVGSER